MLSDDCIADFLDTNLGRGPLRAQLTEAIKWPVNGDSKPKKIGKRSIKKKATMASHF